MKWPGLAATKLSAGLRRRGFPELRVLRIPGSLPLCASLRPKDSSECRGIRAFAVGSSCERAPPGTAGGRSRRAMPLYMDHHKNLEGLSAEAVAADHRRDLEV